MTSTPLPTAITEAIQDFFEQSVWSGQEGDTTAACIQARAHLEG